MVSATAQLSPFRHRGHPGRRTDHDRLPDARTACLLRVLADGHLVVRERDRVGDLDRYRPDVGADPQLTQ